MKIKKLKTEKLIRVLSINNPGLLGSEYLNQIFVMTEDGAGFIDWLNGKKGAFTKPLTAVDYTRLEDAYSTGSGREMSSNTAEYVKTILTARLLIQKNELSYKYEDVSQIGLEPWFKKRQPEVDLILKNLINQTPGVARIKNFKSSVNEKREYTCNVEIICNNGEELWQLIEI